MQDPVAAITRRAIETQLLSDARRVEECKQALDAARAGILSLYGICAHMTDSHALTVKEAALRAIDKGLKV